MEPTKNPYEGLRSRLLDGTAEQYGIRPTDELPDVWAALTDLGMADGTATIATVADGSTSMYTSTGGGILGGGMHEAIAEATLEFLRSGQHLLGTLPKAEAAPLPPTGRVAFVVLTRDGGMRRAEAAFSDFADDAHPLYPLWAGINGVITLLRLVSATMAQEKQGGPPN